MFSSSCFSLSKHNIIVLILKCTCVEFIPSSYHGKIKPKKRKNKKYTNVRKSYSTSRKGIGGRKKTEKISKAKTTTLTYFDNLKKKSNKTKAVKTGIMLKVWSPKISNLRTKLLK